MSNRTHLAILPPIVAVVIGIIGVSCIEKRPSASKNADSDQQDAISKHLPKETAKPNEEAKPSGQPRNSGPLDLYQLRPSDEVVIKYEADTEVPLAKTESAQSDFLKRLKAKDGIGISTLMRSGKIVLAKNGTRVRVIERLPDVESVSVRVLDGIHAGQELIVFHFNCYRE